jgi:hydrophobe/amphiphile efflux-3 (HAE3) family protein
MGLFDYLLEKLAILQKRHSVAIIIFFILFSIFMGVGASRIGFSGDIAAEMPTQLPIYQLNDRITDKFGGQDTIFLLYEIDDSLEQKPLYDDIRHPEILAHMADLEAMLKTESSIGDVFSLGPLISSIEATGAEPTLDMVKIYFEQVPQFAGLVSKDYKMAIMMITADVGTGEEKVTALTELINDKVEALSTPSGVEISITGTPSLVVTILSLLQKDSINTILIASAIIFVLLLITMRSFTKSVLVFVPLIFGLFWTLGAMGWVGLDISVATAGLGAMVLGLGVEYGVFVLTRYREERDKGKNQEDSIKVAVPGVGSAVLGSGFTTIVGFLALTLSVMPMMQKLGLSLAIGIFFSILAAIVFEPAVIIVEENIEYAMTHKKHAILEKKKEIHRRKPR